MDFLSHITPLTTIFFSFLLTFFNIRLNFKNHLNERVFERQNNLYIRFLNLLLSIQRNPYLQFNEKTFHTFEKLQAEFFIYANKECRNDFSEILNLIQKIQSDYKKDRKNETSIDEDNIRIEADSTAIFDIQAEDEHYKDTHKIFEEHMKQKIEITIKHIKKNFGIKE